MRRSDSPADAVPPGGWAALARKLGPKLENVPFGRREQELAAIAQDNGVAPNTLRRAVAAEGKLGLLSKRTAVAESVLAALPLASIEALARWIEFDVRGAKKAARLAVRGDLHARDVVREEREARKQTGLQQWGNSRKAAARKAVKGMLDAQFPKRVTLPRVVGQNDAIDFQFVDGGEKIGVLIFGPHQRLTEWLLAEFVQRVLGLSLLHDKVIAAVPEKDASAVSGELHLRFDDCVDRPYSRSVARRIELATFSDGGVG